MKKIKKMKFTTKLLSVIFLIFSVCGLSSCLKNSSNYVNFADVGASIDLPLSAPSVVEGFSGNSVIFYTYQDSVWNYVFGEIPEDIPVEVSSGSPFIPVYVNVASPSPLGHTVTATLSLDTAYFNTYNASNGGAYALMPANCYSVSSWNLTVPAGQRLDSAIVTFNIANIGSNINYVLPITISTSSLPIEQWNHLLLNVN
jgi:hypothetical protein